MSNAKLNALEAAVVTASFELLVAECALLTFQQKFSMAADKSVNWLMKNYPSVQSVRQLKKDWSEHQIEVFNQSRKHQLSVKETQQLMLEFEPKLIEVMNSQVRHEYYGRWYSAMKIS